MQMGRREADAPNASTPWRVPVSFRDTRPFDREIANAVPAGRLTFQRFAAGMSSGLARLTALFVLFVAHAVEPLLHLVELALQIVDLGARGAADFSPVF